MGPVFYMCVCPTAVKMRQHEQLPLLLLVLMFGCPYNTLCVHLQVCAHVQQLYYLFLYVGDKQGKTPSIMFVCLSMWGVGVMHLLAHGW